MTTKIEWTDETWNPTTGCTKVSPGCDHCYAKTMHERFNGPDSFETVTLHHDRLTLPLRWRKPRKVFVNSMSDLFHKDIPDIFIAQVFTIMAAAPQHTFQVLTKRHARMQSLLSSDRFIELMDEVRVAFGGELADAPAWPLPNVWLGVSVEDQKWADIRIPALCHTPAAVRFLSCEPLLGPLDLGLTADAPIITSRHPLTVGTRPVRRPIDWVIVGGESGHGARPMHPDWVRSLRDQCTDADVAFLFKQWGAHVTRPQMDEAAAAAWDIKHGTDVYDDSVQWRMGKGLAGRELDGRTWDEYPQAVTA